MFSVTYLSYSLSRGMFAEIFMVVGRISFKGQLQNLAHIFSTPYNIFSHINLIESIYYKRGSVFTCSSVILDKYWQNWSNKRMSWLFLSTLVSGLSNNIVAASWCCFARKCNQMFFLWLHLHPSLNTASVNVVKRKKKFFFYLSLIGKAIGAYNAFVELNRGFWVTFFIFASKVHIVQAKSFRVALVPFKHVEQRPCSVSFHVHPIVNRWGDRKSKNC